MHGIPACPLKSRLPSIRPGFAPGDFGSFPTAPGLAASFAHGVDTRLPEHLHSIPMELPELAAKLIVHTLALL
jgi:hypothetical protein